MRPVHYKPASQKAVSKIIVPKMLRLTKWNAGAGILCKYFPSSGISRREMAQLGHDQVKYTVNSHPKDCQGMIHFCVSI